MLRYVCPEIRAQAPRRDLAWEPERTFLLNAFFLWRARERIVFAVEGLSEDEEPAWLAELLAGIDLIVLGMSARDAAHQRCWKDLRRDLRLLAQAARISPELAAPSLGAVVAAVETAILLYHLQLGDR